VTPGDAASPREVVARANHTFEHPLEISDDMTPVQRAFAGLMDRVTADLQRLDLDSDDCVLDRFAALRIDELPAEIELPAEFLATRADFLKPLSANNLSYERASKNARRIVMVRAVVEAVRTPDYPATKHRPTQ